MDSDKEEYLPASQLIVSEKEKEQETENSQEAGHDAAQAGKSTRQKTKTKEKQKAKDPCIYCGENCVKGTVQCAVCALWCHMKCNRPLTGSPERTRNPGKGGGPGLLGLQGLHEFQ